MILTEDDNTAHPAEQGLIDLVPDAIIACDLAGCVTFWSDGAQATYGWSAGEARGQRIGELLQEQAMEVSLDEIALSVIETGRWRGEREQRTKDGMSVVVEGHWALRTDPAGQPAGLLVVNRDVTARRTVEDEARAPRARLEDLIDMAPEAIVTVDEVGTITLFNKGAEAIFCYTAAEVLGRPLAILLPVEVRIGSEQDLQRFAGGAQGPGLRRDVSGQRKDGSCFPAEAAVSKLRRGDRVTFTIIVRDASEREAAEDALTDSERRLSAILDTLPVGVVGSRANGDVAYENRVARQLFGERGRIEEFSRATGRGLAGASETYSPERLPLARALNNEAGVMTDLEVSGHGRTIPLRIIYGPVHDASGRVEFGVEVLEDVTDEKDAERRMAQQADQLARSNAELEQFAYVASHDLSEPLRTVAGFVQLLAQRYQGHLDDDADEFIGFALDGVKRMQNLIQDLLTYSRVSRLEYKLENVDSQKVAVEVGEVIDSAGAVTYSQLPTVLADAGQLQRVFQNLIGNGLKFVPPGREPHVHLSAARDGANWRFEVKDNGIGIAAHHTDRIFKMFQRLHSQDDFPGTGIGLAVCQRIVERHGGRIWVESTEGEGSTFFFTLPAPAP
jgi:PAS domain S-box-containing protein